jgi:hypothetical protein
MAGLVQGIFFALEGGAEMQSVQAATALEGCGLEGDRYCAGTGHWSRFAGTSVGSEPIRTAHGARG